MLIGMVEFSLITDPVASLSIIDLGSAAKEELTTREPDGEIKVPFNKLRFFLGSSLFPVGNFRISNRGLRDSKACQEFGQGGNW
jgi:hypothetical protein